MANKTILAHLLSLPGITGLTLHLTAPATPDTTLNGSGTACALVGTSQQSCVVTGALATYGWLVAIYKQGSVEVARGPIWIPGDVEGDYIVDDKEAEQRAAQNYAYLPPQNRSEGDVQPLRFQWPVLGAVFTGCTKELGSDPPAAIPSVQFQFLRTVEGDHTYQMLYNAADRPLKPDAVLYRLSDGTNKRKLMLNILALGGSNGLYTITITVQDSAAGAIAGATVVVKNTDQTRTIGWGSTNSLGQIAFHLNAGTYKVIVDALSSQYNPLAVQTLVVSANGSVTYTLTTQSIDPPLTPGLATVRFLVLNSGAPLQNAKVTVWLEDDNPTVETALLSRQKTQGTTDVSGVVDLVMVHESAFTRGGVYHVEVSDSNGKRLHERRVTVPQVGTCYAEDLIDATA